MSNSNQVLMWRPCLMRGRSRAIQVSVFVFTGFDHGPQEGRKAF